MSDEPETTPRLRRQITIDFEVGEDDDADAIADEIAALLDRSDAIGFLTIRSVPADDN